jgi:hypothetical protein
MARSKAKRKVKKVTDINSATHIALPQVVFNELSNLIGGQIKWGVADPVMSRVKQSAILVELLAEEAESVEAIAADNEATG